MIVDAKEYGQMIGIDAAAVRMRISRANGDALQAGLVGVITAEKKAGGWVFIIDAKIVHDYVKKDLADTKV